MKIGFTGTRKGMTPEQKKAVETIFLDYCGIELHHGACIGADEDAVVILKTLDYSADSAIAHPGVSAKGGDNAFLSHRAVELSVRSVQPKTHFARNRDIVNETELLIACPPCEPLPESGGTSYTVGYAKKVKKPVLIVWPSGFIE